MPIYSQIGLVLLWIFFILEVFVATYMMAHKKAEVFLWVITRALPLLLITMGFIK